MKKSKFLDSKNKGEYRHTTRSSTRYHLIKVLSDSCGLCSCIHPYSLNVGVCSFSYYIYPKNAGFAIF